MSVAVDPRAFPPGVVLLTGANGAGKSTVARAWASSTPGAELLSAESQQAFYEAELARDESNFQEAVDTGSTVGRLLGEAARAHPLVSALRLAPLWGRGYRSLSTGEARKTLLAAALLRAPALVVLDDPFEGLDAAACDELARALERAAREVPVVVAGTFAPGRLPLAEPREVVVVARSEVVFRGSPSAWAEHVGAHAGACVAPPVDEGSFYEAIDRTVPLVDLVRGHVRYGESVVFEGLDFRVRPGEHTMIRGPNGSGKSSLLEMLTGDHPQAYANELWLFGRRRGTGETVWDIKKNVGVVSARLHRDYRVAGTIEEVLVSGLFDSIGVYVATEASHRARARAWLAWLGMGLRADTPFHELSYGQQRLVLIARAAIKVPPLVVLDEPTAGLDDENRARVLELVASLCAQEKSTVLFVTHRDDERAFWTSRIRGAELDLGARARASATSA